MNADGRAAMRGPITGDLVARGKIDEQDRPERATSSTKTLRKGLQN